MPSQTRKAYVNVQEHWENGKGKRNTVLIRNGTAIKKVEQLNASGRVVAQKTRKLTASEKKKILNRQFVKGLWKNCCA
jgi:hypothetical protein